MREPQRSRRSSRHALVAYKVGGSTLFFVCRKTLGEALPPGPRN